MDSIHSSTRRRRRTRVLAAVAASVAGLTLASCSSSGGAGALDTSFGDKGTVEYSLGEGDDTANGMILGADGTIVVVGTTTSADS
ncbi:MAG: hypothetical protein ACO3S5_06400, partial [Ilumatobacteraceae bacterium]